MPRRSRAESEATRRRLLEVAREAFAEHGYGGVSLEQVATAAGVTRGAVYHHYADKAALFRAVLAEVQRAVAAAVERATEGADDPREALRTGCRAWLAAAADPAHRRILLVDAPAVLDWNAWRAQDDAHSGRLLAEALADLRLPDAAALAALLNGAMNEAALWVAGPGGDPDSARAALDRLLDGLLSG